MVFSLKRLAENNKQDLRSKISKPTEVVVPTQAVQPRKKIVYGDANFDKESAKTTTDNSNRGSNMSALTQKNRENKVIN